MFWQRTKSPRRPSRTPRGRIRPILEELESRVVPFVMTGDAWLHPELVTISFMADSTDLFNNTGKTGDMFARFNQLSDELATWLQQSNTALNTIRASIDQIQPV